MIRLVEKNFPQKKKLVEKCSFISNGQKKLR